MRFSQKLIVLFSGFTLTLASFSCSYTQQQALFGGKKNINAPQDKASTPVKYGIKPQDLLQIRNLQNKKYIVDEAVTDQATTTANPEGQTYLVEADSSVALPILGRVKVGGLTRLEAARKIELLYSKELRDPIIELKIINLKVTLLGEVKSQGIYKLLKDQTSLIEVIGEAGGLTEKANSEKIKIIRGGLQNPQIIELNLGDLQTLSDSRIMLQNDDIIYVAQNKRAIRSDKLQSMSTVLQPVITLLNTALIIYTLSR